ncbi:hypothetical protein NMY22_g7423 [Coprinellus aureogranulatus]|nr:hypothetical protein NMY22_g7423 [Coprinellus aureogranulatus]
MSVQANSKSSHNRDVIMGNAEGAAQDLSERDVADAPPEKTWAMNGGLFQPCIVPPIARRTYIVLNSASIPQLAAFLWLARHPVA